MNKIFAKNVKKLLFGLLITSNILFADLLKVGDTILDTSYKNQFDQTISISKDTKELILVFSKDDGERVKNFLISNPNYLQGNKSIYFADISGAPSLVTSMFMKPKFKKYPFSMVLIDDEKVTSKFPKMENKITIISVENLKIKKIDFKTNL